MIATTVAELVKRFVSLVEEIYGRRRGLGLVVTELRNQGHSWPNVRQLLETAVPNAKLMIGVTLTEANLQALAAIANTGAITYDGKNWLEPEQQDAIAAALGSDPDEVLRIIAHAKAGNLNVRKLSKLGKQLIQENADGTEVKDREVKLNGIRDTIGRAEAPKPEAGSIEEAEAKLEVARLKTAGLRTQLANAIVAEKEAERKLSDLRNATAPAAQADAAGVPLSEELAKREAAKREERNAKARERRARSRQSTQAQSAMTN